ncbi:MAG TPA: disulfide bond formation protein DsbA, partial [Microbacteriaceae bacterium]|nr:disulfide bond formation protein DsbA [Microbacteriaceae bacterium]
MSSGTNQPSKKERREAAREKARLMREAEKRRAKRRRWLVQGSVGLGVLVVLAIIAVVVVTTVRPAGPGPRNMASGGILFTSSTKAALSPAQASGAATTPTKQDDSDGKAHITVYIDYQCPYC